MQKQSKRLCRSVQELPSCRQKLFKGSLVCHLSRCARANQQDGFHYQELPSCLQRRFSDAALSVTCRRMQKQSKGEGFLITSHPLASTRHFESNLYLSLLPSPLPSPSSPTITSPPNPHLLCPTPMSHRISLQPSMSFPQCRELFPPLLPSGPICVLPPTKQKKS